MHRLVAKLSMGPARYYINVYGTFNVSDSIIKNAKNMVRSSITYSEKQNINACVFFSKGMGNV